MKRIFTLLLGTLFSLSLLAYDGTRLTVSSVGNTTFRVEIDGRRYNMNKNGLSIRDLSAGRHTIKIYRERKRNNSVWNFGNRQEVVFSQTIHLKRDYHFDITISRFGKVMVDERRMDRNDDWYEEDDDYYGRDDRWDDFNGREMNDREFNQARESLRNEWMETTRLNLAKQVVDRNYFTSQQVRSLLQLFSFENNKLDLAKYAYGKVTDKRNYHVVNDVFSFNNSKEELARFIREHR